MGIQKRLDRRQRRKARRERIENLVATGQKINLAKITSTEDFLHNFELLWPYLSEALTLLKPITRAKGDRAIDELIMLGTRISTGEATLAQRSKFFKVFGTVWSGIRLALNLIALISPNKKLDNAIDDIIHIGDLINNYEPPVEHDI